MHAPPTDRTFSFTVPHDPAAWAELSVIAQTAMAASLAYFREHVHEVVTLHIAGIPFRVAVRDFTSTPDADTALLEVVE